MPPAAHASDRRPIRTRDAAWAAAMARTLVRGGVSPNAISLAGMVPALVAGVALALTPHTDHPRWLFAIAAFLIPLRLLANMLDGMVAVEGGRASPVGELYNEVPDRVSDTAVLVGAGYALTSSPMLGVFAALAALWVTYIRALGKGAGQKSDFRGPMAKQQRMIVVIVASIYLAAAPGEWWTVTIAGRTCGLMILVLAVVIFGCIVTAARRLHGVAAGLQTEGNDKDQDLNTETQRH